MVLLTGNTDAPISRRLLRPTRRKRKAVETVFIVKSIIAVMLSAFIVCSTLFSGYYLEKEWISQVPVENERVEIYKAEIEAQQLLIISINKKIQDDNFVTNREKHEDFPRIAPAEKIIKDYEELIKNSKSDIATPRFYLLLILLEALIFGLSIWVALVNFKHKL